MTRREASNPRPEPRPLRATLVVAIAALAVWAYRNSFGGPFLWDGVEEIANNPRIHSLGLGALAGTSRPLVRLSFALNYAAGGLDVVGYHAVNLAIHVLAALALFAVAARTFASERLAPRFGKRATWLASAVAALWVVHPLQTESVTYVVQRAESLAGLFFFALLYAFLRAAESKRALPWWNAAVACMVLGIASKPIMAVAPLVVLLYDRCFLAGSLRACLEKRGRSHAALFASAMLLPLALLGGRSDWQSSTGFDLATFTPASYALTQLAVVPHYLRLALWPAPLVLDYAWPAATSLADVMPGAAIVIPLLVLTAIGVARNHPLGFLGAWVFVILAPTSSFFPIQDAAFEHRMYLPLAGIVALAVAGLSLVAGPAASKRARPGASPLAPAAVALVIVVAVALAHMTTRRNRAYQSAVAMWSDVIAKHPSNPRAHVFLGQSLADGGHLDEAIEVMETAVELNPDYGLALGSLTRAREMANRLSPADAARDYARALAMNPDMRWTRAYLGLALVRAGRPAEALRELDQVLALEPDLALAHYGRGVALVALGRITEGRAELAQVVAANPEAGMFRRALAWADSVANAAATR